MRKKIESSNSQKGESRMNEGACEKAVDHSCKFATENCFKNAPARNTASEKRYIDCSAWKLNLGLTFISQLGIYLLCHCPLCDADLVEAAKKRN